MFENLCGCFSLEHSLHKAEQNSITYNRGHNLKTGALRIKFPSSMAQETGLSWGLAKGVRE